MRTYSNVEKFEKKLSLFREYYFLYGKVPKKKYIYKGEKIGVWFITQKYLYKKHKLSEERIKRLKEIDVDIFNKKSDRLERGLVHFLYMASLLREYYLFYGDVPTIDEKYKGERIGTWFFHKKYLYKNGKLSSYKENVLKGIDSDIFSKVSEFGKKHFEYMVEILKEFYSLYGRFPKSLETYKNEGIGKWLTSQRYVFNKGKMLPRRVKVLTEIDSKILQRMK